MSSFKTQDTDTLSHGLKDTDYCEYSLFFSTINTYVYIGLNCLTLYIIRTKTKVYLLAIPFTTLVVVFYYIVKIKCHRVHCTINI